ncbi:MAG TPA: hypothetical protein VK081_04960 [Planctomycetota bacterium]|nr:hypothetical protein [Planctomycetota bacterium]
MAPDEGVRPSDASHTPGGGGGALAAILLFAVAAEEGARVVLDRPWPGFPAAASHTVGLLLAALWTTCGVAILLRHAAPAWGALSWLLAVASPIAMLAHGLVTRVVGSPWGLLFVPGALVATFLLRRAFLGGDFARLRSRLRHAHDA